MGLLDFFTKKTQPSAKRKRTNAGYSAVEPDTSEDDPRDGGVDDSVNEQEEGEERVSLSEYEEPDRNGKTEQAVKRRRRDDTPDEAETPASISPQIEQTILPSPVNQSQQVKTLLASKKQLTLAAKRDGRLDEAREYMSQIIRLRKLEEETSEGKQVDLSEWKSEIPPSFPNPSQNTRQKMITLLTKQLSHQYQQLLSECKERKEKRVSLDASSIQVCKRTKEDLEWLRLFVASQPDGLPLYEYEEVERTKKIENNHLTDQQLEVFVEATRLVDAKNIPKEFYLSLQLPYPSEAHQTIKSGYIPNQANQRVEWAGTFKIERKKSFQLACNSKKISIELCNSTFFGGKTTLGTGSLTLSDLLTKSNSKQIVEIRKKRHTIIAVLEITIRLRTPINGPDIERNTQKYIKLKREVAEISSESETVQPMNDYSVVDEPAEIQIIHDNVPHDTLQQPPPDKFVTSDKTVPGPAAVPMDTDKRAPPSEEEFNSPEGIQCNDVLEYEIVVCRERMKKSKTLEEKETEEDRLQRLQTRLVILGAQVSGGVLTPENYSEKLREEMEKNKGEMVRYVKEGKRDRALLLKKHNEIMANELKVMAEG